MYPWGAETKVHLPLWQKTASGLCEQTSALVLADKSMIAHNIISQNTFGANHAPNIP